MRSRQIIFVLLLSLVLTSHSNAQWSPLNSGTQNHLSDVFFIDAQTGWVVGDAGLVMKTTDGGTNWSSQTLGIADIISVSFLDPDTGYALSVFSLPYVTYDGGATWAQDSSLGGCFSKFLDFNDRILYVAYDGCFGGAWLYTLDPATKDTTEWFEFQQVTTFEDFGFPQPGHAIALGQDDMRARTTDGGDNWTITAPNDTAMDWVALDFVSPLEGYAVNKHIFTPLYKTLDGGLTWALDSTWGSTFFYPTPTDLDYRDSGYGFVTTDIQWSTQGVIFEIRPSTWANYIPIPNVPRAIHMVTDSVGYVVGDSGMIWKRTGGPLGISPGGHSLDFQIYPNPAGSDVNVLWAGKSAGLLSIYNPDGRLVSQFPAQPGTARLDLSGIAGGVYLVRLDSEGASAVKRLVLVH